MKSGFDRVLRRYGRPAALWQDGAQVAVGLALVQPLYEKEAQRLPTPLGRQRTDRCLYLGEAGLAVDQLGEEDWLAWEGQAYQVLNAQPVALGGTVLYRWAILTVREEEP